MNFYFFESIFQVLFCFHYLKKNSYCEKKTYFLSCTSPTPSDIFVPNFTITADTRDVTTLQFRVQ